jgi:hypothetical protein
MLVRVEEFDTPFIYQTHRSRPWPTRHYEDRPLPAQRTEDPARGGQSSVSCRQRKCQGAPGD